MRDCEVNIQCSTYIYTSIYTDTLIQIFIVSSAEVTRSPDTGIRRRGAVTLISKNTDIFKS